MKVTENSQLYDWVLRDKDGRPIYLKADLITEDRRIGTCNNTAELYGLCRAIIEVVPLLEDYTCLIIQSDNSSVTVDLKKGKSEQNDENNDLVAEAKDILDGLELEGNKVIVEFVPRPVNKLVDYIVGKWQEKGIFDGLKDHEYI